MTVNRPLTVSGSGSNQTFGGGQGGPRLSDSERERLRGENGPTRFGLQDLGDPGDKFSTEQFVSTQQLSFSSGQVTKTAELLGVQEAAGALTLNLMKISGTVPEAPTQGSGGRGGGVIQQGGPRSINSSSSTITGIDATKSDLAPVTPSQVTKGSYLSKTGGKYEALLNVSYAKQKGLSVGEKLTLKGKQFTVVGLTSAPLGGSASDIYVRLSTLQQLSDRKGRVNVIQVRTATSGDVAAVEKRIESSFSGSSVTTSQDLADRVGGSLTDAKNLSSKLGAALAAVALIAAFLIATLLTLSGVAKRTRELGTLKAIGWRQRLVVRQITAESLAQGLLGGVFGAAIGIGAAALITAFGPELKATVEATGATGAAGGPGAGGPFGLGRSTVTTGSQLIKLDAPVDLTLIALAIGLALLGGLLAGAVGGARAARLRPAEALRSVE
jgi:putative ABC transport system permease protein